MKRLHFLLAALVVLIAASCSKSTKTNGLLQQIPAETDLVVIGNIKTVVQSAGGSLEGSNLKLPAFLSSHLPSYAMEDIEEMTDFLKNSGINAETAAMFLDYKHPDSPVVVFAIENKKQFIDTIEDYEFEEQTAADKVVIYARHQYYDIYDYIAVNGSYAYWTNGNPAMARYLQNIIDDAGIKSFAKTSCGNYIAGGNTLGAAITIPDHLKRNLRRQGIPSELLSFYDGIICMRGSISGDKCTIDFKHFDEDGREAKNDFKDWMDTASTIDADALKFLGKDEFAVYATSIKNVQWDKYADMLLSNLSRSERAQANVVLSYFEKIDGTVAAGFGLTDGLESMAAISYDEEELLSNISSTVIIQTRDGKAKQLLNDLKGFLDEAHIPFDESASGLSVDMDLLNDTPGVLYAEHRGNCIVIANHPIKESSNPVVNEVKMSKYMQAFAVVLKRDNKLMRDLRCDNDIKFTTTCTPKTMDVSMTLEVNGSGSDGLVAKVMKMIIDIAERADSLEEEYFDSIYYRY